MIELFIHMLIHAGIPAVIMMLLGAIIDYTLGWKIGEIIFVCGLLYMPVWEFRFAIWDFKKTFFKILNFFVKKTDNLIAGIMLGAVTFFLLLVTIGCVRPSLNDTYRYKQVDYEVGDTILVGDHKYIADGLYEAKVVSVKEATFSDGTPNPFFYEDEYTLDTGETVPRSRIFGIETGCMVYFGFQNPTTMALNI